MGRIEKVFENLKKRKEGVLLVYFMPTEPLLEENLNYCLEIERAGVDFLEIGVPWKNPYLDGPVIYQAHRKALSRSMGTEETMDLIKILRKVSSIPVVLMIYYQAILPHGFTSFLSLAKEVSADGILIPDLPPEKREYSIEILKELELSHIFMVSPKNSYEEIKEAARKSSGFLYMASNAGLTGIKNFPKGYLSLQVKRVKVIAGQTIPLVVGFGLSKEEDISEVIKAGAQGAVVGSSIIKRIEERKPLYPYIRSLKNATIGSL